jgi:Thiol-activated cytolysin
MTVSIGLRTRSAFTYMWLVTGSMSAFAACGSDEQPEPNPPGAAGEGGGEQAAAGAGDGGSSPQGGAGGSSGEGGAPGSAGSGGAAGADAGGAPGTEGDPAVQAYFDGLTDWPEAPAASDITTQNNLSRELTIPNGGARKFSCSVTQHDIVEQRRAIVNLDSAAPYIKPGAVLSGDDFAKGELTPLSLPRAPITLSIDVPGVAEPTVRVENPTLANIQKGISALQGRAKEATMGTSYAGDHFYEQHAVESVEEMAHKLEVGASFDAAFASGSFSAAFEGADSQQKFTVYSNLLQSMYTITFSHDSFETGRDFFSSSLSLEQIEEAERAGYLSPDNPPVFIGSVTYGRMVVFTATSTQVESSSQIETQLNAAGTNWKGNAALTAEQKAFMSTLDIEVLSVGGNQTDISSAIRTGDWSLLYAGADILNSVPLRYEVRSLSGVRPIAVIGDTTQFSKTACTPAEAWTKFGDDGITFTDISSNPQNNPVFAIGEVAGVRKAYKFDGRNFGVIGSDPLDPTNIAVDVAGNAFIQHAGVIWRLPISGGGWSNTGLSGGQLEIDAGATNWLVALSGTYAGDQNDIRISDGAATWTAVIDDAQTVRVNEPHWLTAVDKSWIGRWGGDLLRYDPQAGTTVLSNQTANLDTVSRYSAASGAEVYAVNKPGTQIMKLNRDNQLFELNAEGPLGHTIKDLEAVAANQSNSNRFWVVTTAGKVYAYTPK